MKIRVGKITYLNSEPFYYKLVRDDIELVNFVPSALGKAAEQGEIDAGPLPLVDFFRLQDRFKQLAQFCICTVDKSRSVLMFAKKPIQDLEGATIGVTGPELHRQAPAASSPELQIRSETGCLRSSD